MKYKGPDHHRDMKTKKWLIGIMVSVFLIVILRGNRVYYGDTSKSEVARNREACFPTIIKTLR
jgi:hypothetical protein